MYEVFICVCGSDIREQIISNRLSFMTMLKTLIFFQTSPKIKTTFKNLNEKLLNIFTYVNKYFCFFLIIT